MKRKLKSRLSALTLAMCFGITGLGVFSLTGNAGQGEVSDAFASHVKVVYTTSSPQTGSVSD